MSIIIPTCDAVLEKNSCLYFTLKSLAAQLAVTFEVLIVDNSESAGSLDWVSTEFPHFKVIPSAGGFGNTAAARNTGASHARADVLMFLDDDTVLASRISAAAIRAAVEHNRFACGANRYWTAVNWYTHIQRHQSFGSIVDTLAAVSILPKGINTQLGYRDLNEFTFIGNCGAVERSAFEVVGGFDETFRGWGMEDTDLMMKLCLHGFEFSHLANHNLSVYHLTHTRFPNPRFSDNFARFNDLQVSRGYYFHVNHFFGIYEADGHQLFTKV